MTPDELDRIAARAKAAFTYPGFHQVAAQDVPALVAEVQQLNRDIEVLRSVGERDRDQSRRLTHVPGACPTACDDDCDAACHEEHEVSYKRAHRPPGEPAEEHAYLSTSCLHGDLVLPSGRTGHEYCQGETGLCGAKVPGVCKWCAAPCECPCHRDDAKGTQP